MRLSSLYTLISILFLSASTSLSAQDLLAKQAPIDRKMKSVDSVTLHRLIQKEETFDAIVNLYSSWDNQKAHPYAAEKAPETFKIDLRGFCMPTPSRNVTSGFGYRPAFRRVHKGLDIKVYTGDTIVSAWDGKVRVCRYDAKGYGYFVIVRHPNGLETVYGHLSKQLVKVNQTVKAGEPIGLGGNTGASYGSHLHFETRLVNEAIDPAEMFDFANQDVIDDYYVFKRGKTRTADHLIVASNRYNTRGTQTNETTEPATVEKTKAPAKQPKTSKFYKVKSGDSLYSISKKLHVNMNHLLSSNRLSKKSNLRPGQILKY